MSRPAGHNNTGSEDYPVPVSMGGYVLLTRGGGYSSWVTGIIPKDSAQPDC